MWKANQKTIENLILNINPDLILIENSFNLPFIMRMKYKWSMIISTNILKIGDQGVGIKRIIINQLIIINYNFFFQIRLSIHRWVAV